MMCGAPCTAQEDQSSWPAHICEWEKHRVPENYTSLSLAGGHLRPSGPVGQGHPMLSDCISLDDTLPTILPITGIGSIHPEST